MQERVEGNGMRCPKCGAENADYLFYCGSCASDLRDVPAKRADTTPLEVAPQGRLDSAVMHRAELKKSFRQMALMFGAFAALGLFLEAQSLLDGELSYLDLGYLLMTCLVVCISIYVYRLSTDEEKLSNFRLGGWVGNVSAEASGLSLNSLTVGLPAAAVVVIFGVMLMAFDPELIIFSAVFTSVVIGSVLLAMIYWPFRITLEETGICIGYPSRIRPFIPFEMISSIALKKKMLRVTLNKRPLLGYKTHRFLLLKDIDDMRSELDRIAPSGVPIRAMATPHPKDAEMSETEIVYVGTDRSMMLTHAGIALIIAGIFAFMNAAVLFALEGRFFTLGSSPLFCCGSFEVLCGAIAILGGVQTIRGGKYRMSVVASIFAILSVGGLVVSPALGIISLVITYRNREDFRD